MQPAFTVDGGYRRRTDTLSRWVKASDIAHMEQEELDAVSGATPSAGKITFFWDETDQSGNRVSYGKYVMKLEGTLYWSSNVLFEGVIDMLNPTEEIEVTATYSEADETNKDMIQNVEMKYTK